MNYTVKRASQAVELDNGWDAGQWKNANGLELKNYMGDKPEHFPKTQAKLLYDDENLYVFFKVEDNYIRCVADKTHDSVCQDSCVEFFFTPKEENLEGKFFNLETNCGGTMLFYYGEKKERQPVTVPDCESIEIYHSMPKIITEEITEPATWTLSYKLPFDLAARYSEMTGPQSGVNWKANFYKCADRTSYPHWLTWSFVDNLTPDFHLPQYFGDIEFE